MDMFLRAQSDAIVVCTAIPRNLVDHLDDEENFIAPLIPDRVEMALGVGH